ncbi:MAG: histidine kinase dimerization/phosphoacceptor domain -containing protein [Spirochaetota bacterium]
MAFKLFSPDVLHTEPLRYDLVYSDTAVQRERTILTKSGRRLPVMMNTRKIEDNVLQAIFHDVSQLRAAEQSLRESEERFRLQAKDGTYRWITGRRRGLFDEEGNPVRFAGFNTDITAQKEQAEKVNRLLEEKDYFLAEVTHRVKNNLAMVSSLINLKQSALQDKIDLSDRKHQINAIRIVHDKLHTTQQYSSIEFETYSRELLREIFAASAAPPVQLDMDVYKAAIPVKAIIPLGLILNEIATNAIK